MSVRSIDQAIDQFASPARGAKSAILMAALEILSKEGLSEVSVTRLAKQAGISKQLVLYHYPKTQSVLMDLFVALTSKAQELTKKEVAEAKTMEEQVAAVVRGAFLWAINDARVAQFLLLVYHLAGVDPAIRALHQEVLRTGQDRIEGILSKSKRFSVVSERQQTAVVIQSLILGHIFRMVSTGDTARAQTYLRSLLPALEGLIGKRIPPRCLAL